MRKYYLLPLHSIAVTITIHRRRENNRNSFQCNTSTYILFIRDNFSSSLSSSSPYRLAMRTNWCKDETESSGCLWGYSMINASCEMQKVAIATLSLLTGIQKDIWIFSVGFLGFWGLKCATPVGEETLQLISDFLEGSSVNDSDDCEYSDIVLCLTALFIWVNKLPKSVYRERTLNTLLVQLSTISYKSRGSVQLFWSDALVPILESKMDLKTHSKKVKSFSNSSRNPLRDLLEWVGGVPGLVLGLGDALCDLLCESNGESDAIEGEKIGETTDETVGEDTEMDVEIEKEEFVNEKSKKRKLSIDNDAGDIGVRVGKKETEKKMAQEMEDDDEDDVDLGSFELDYSGSKESVIVSDSVKGCRESPRGAEKKGSEKGGNEKEKGGAKGVLNYLAETVEVFTGSGCSFCCFERISNSNKHFYILYFAFSQFHSLSVLYLTFLFSQFFFTEEIS
jgi:hypothetical protein